MEAESEGTLRPIEHVRRRKASPRSDAAGFKGAASSPSPIASSAGWRALKRSFDIATALVLIIVSLPLFLIIALAIEMESPGSVFFAHRRLRQGGTEFGLIKFRTMVPDAEARLQTHLQAYPDQMAEWKARYKLRNDPRVTRVGRVLRKTSLDELPQLFNVLAGTVSLVGPRAIVRDEVERFGAYAPTILSIKPGMTGLWAVSGRSEVSQRERALLEYRYVMEWSFLGDLQILLQTIPAVLHGHGAY
jgi:lipopolysaccharide/colanic/teichoic acid biosynthesis glycosyltransferase